MLRERLADVLSEVEARVDFAEDVGGVEVPPHVIEAIHGVDSELGSLLAGASYARAIREGIRLPLVGRPNVGKSSLFNALVGEDRAIVTETPGTTRDRVSESIGVAGICVTLSDTAGLRETTESVEAIGIARTERALEESRLILWVVDGSVPLEAEDHGIAARLTEKRVLVALNKGDLGSVVAPSEIERLLSKANRRRVIPVSAARGDGLEELERAIPAMLDAPSGVDAHHAAVSNLRHVEALSRARTALGRAAEAGREGAPGEIVAFELRESLSAIGEVTGEVVGEDLLDRIFSRFCIGK
jgi:tRNA modification GTPase